LEEYDPDWDGRSVRVVGPESEEPAAIVFFPSFTAFTFGGPKDEALHGHPLHGRGLEPYGAFEVKRSTWISELEQMNSVHERHDPRRYARLRHFVFTFHDTPFECVAQAFDVYVTGGSHAALLVEMQSLLRREIPTVLLIDRQRDRFLDTALYLPPGDERVPLIVFAHGWYGHPRKFTRLFQAWCDAGFAVAAPAFPRTNDEAPEVGFDDVVEQPRDVTYVIDALVREQPRIDPARIGVGGFSLGGMTALAVGFNAGHRDPRVRAVCVMAGRFYEKFGGEYEMTEMPLLLVHGTQDASVPYGEGLSVYEAARGPKQLVTIEGDHDIAQDSSPHLDEVIGATIAFWREYL
jgi:dienelactone hydrolase